MADCNRYSVGVAAREVSFALGPLTSQLETGSVLDLLTELGYSFPPELVADGAFSGALDQGITATLSLPNRAQAVLDSFDSDLVTVLTKTGQLLEALVEVFDALASTGQSLKAFAAGAPGLNGPDVLEFGERLADRLLDYFVIRYLEGYYPRLLAFLRLLGVVQITPLRIDSNDPLRPPYYERKLLLERIPQLFTDPQRIMREDYGWGEASFDGQALLERVSELLDAYAVPHTLARTRDGAATSLRVLLFSLIPRLDVDPRGLEARLNFTLEEPFTLKFPFFVPDWFVEITAKGALDEGLAALVQPPGQLSLVPPTGVLDGNVSLAVVADRPAPKPPFALLSLPFGCVLARRASIGIGVDYDWNGAAAVGGPTLEFKLEKGEFHVGGARDGFLSTLLPANGASFLFDFGFGWSEARGVFFSGGGGLETTLSIHQTIGPLLIERVRIRLKFEGDEVLLVAGVLAAAQLGPITAVVDSISFGATLGLHRGNLGPLDLSPTFVPPEGVGIVVDAGGVRGGGFLYFFFDEGRYAGALELSVFGIAVKAFGLIDTKLPDGTSGFSFVIVIVAEFTPIQLGFGFTLLGVGGLVAVNRTLNDQGLADAIRTGSLSHLLFPRNPVADAPAIIHDLTTVFPAAKGHFILGPMAKLGWGTPTLITADLGIVLELPGPRIAILGVVRMQLPKPDFAVVSLQMAVGGRLDFPAKQFALDASLFDSVVAGYPVSGDMAYRMGFGDKPSFLMSVGGFNPGFEAPSGTPTLRRAAVDIGVNGNPSLVASGYFALTSNTAQIGASIELNAHGGGIRLHGWLGFDVLFIFSPFSFTASISAGMRVSFHGAGIGITLRGSLSGPTPWHLKGKVCVSVLWWDACLGIDETFGSSRPAALPELDPWTGQQDPDPRLSVTGLQQAVRDARSWSGQGSFVSPSVVSLSAAATVGAPPIDPRGAATLRQRVVPLQQTLEKFGQYKPIRHTRFDLSSVQVGTSEVPLSEVTPVTDDFAPANYLGLSNAEKLSSKSYLPMQAGFSVRPDRVTIGSTGTQAVVYETAFIDAEGKRNAADPFAISQQVLRGMLKRTGSALLGTGRSGPLKYVPAGRPRKVRLAAATFSVVDACSGKTVTEITPAPTTEIAALLALREKLRSAPAQAGRLTLVPAFAAQPP